MRRFLSFRQEARYQDRRDWTPGYRTANPAAFSGYHWGPRSVQRPDLSLRTAEPVSAAGVISFFHISYYCRLLSGGRMRPGRFPEHRRDRYTGLPPARSMTGEMHDPLLHRRVRERDWLHRG